MTIYYRFVAALLAMPLAPQVTANDDAGRALLNAVNNGSIAELRQALAQGANPDVTFGRFYEDKPFCIATETGKEDLLQELINAGARVDFIYEEQDAVSISPLQCAAMNDNLAAFTMLHEAGAQIRRDECPSCDVEYRSTVLLSSFSPLKYDVGRYIIENADVLDREEYMIKRGIENRRIGKNDPTLADRAWIVEWLEERGYEVTPTVPE